jgi:hypothetical protein
MNHGKNLDPAIFLLFVAFFICVSNFWMNATSISIQGLINHHNTHNRVYKTNWKTDSNSSQMIMPNAKPDLCVAITYNTNVRDKLKALAMSNTMAMYDSLRPRVSCFLVNSNVGNLSDVEWPWETLDPPATNEHGTPLFMSLIERVDVACPGVPLLAYVNADILFDKKEMIGTLDALLDWNRNGKEFIGVGRRKNHDLTRVLDPHDVTRVDSELFVDVAQDYFIMTRGVVDRLSESLPPYVIGRRGYDNAIVDWAYHRECLIDLTETLTAMHQTTSDGNYAGHSDRNHDKEYNVQLPNAAYDHDSTGHAQFASKKSASGSVAIVHKDTGNVVVGMAVESDLPKDIQFTVRGKPATSLPSPLFVTFGNMAYKEMLGSMVCNFMLFPPMNSHLLVLVTDKELVRYLESMDSDIIIGYYPHEIQERHDYDTPNYVRLMLLRGQLLVKLLGHRVVIWLEADAAYYENLLNHPKITDSSTDIVFFLDHAAYGGGFIQFAATTGARDFYAKVVDRMERGIEHGDFTNDQAILNDIAATSNLSFSVFDECAFRAGTFYTAEFGLAMQERCKGIRPVVQQHNWIVGTPRKVEMAKKQNMWFLDDDAPQLACKQRDLKLIVMTMDRPKSLERLLNSVASAAYPDNARIDVQVSVDRRAGQGHDAETMKFLSSFQWARGVFEVIAWAEPKGIFGQWVDSWPCEIYKPDLYKAVVFFEDDLEVSPIYFEWFANAHRVYASPNLGAITGMRAALVAQEGARLSVSELVPTGVQVFAYRLIATWSMSPTHDSWKRFREWVKVAKADPNFDPAVDGTVPGQWYRDFKAHGKEAGMWEAWYMRFMHDQGLYTLYPWVDNGANTIVCNWREKGLHYSGDDASQDYPLVLSLPTEILAQTFVPYVDWGLAFYYCLTDYLFGDNSNQILTIAWGQKRALENHKYLRLSTLHTSIQRRLHLTEHWNELFDNDAISLFRMDGVDDERCAVRETMENTFWDMFQMRAANVTLPVPRRDFRDRVERDPRKISVSVHGRSMDGNCHESVFVCTTVMADKSSVVDTCDYSEPRIREVFDIHDENVGITLFTDGQNEAAIQTYGVVDDRPFFEQLWAMVLSPHHIGNPKSSMDFLIYLWRRQLGIPGVMEPAACYT